MAPFQLDFGLALLLLDRPSRRCSIATAFLLLCYSSKY